MAAKAFEPTSGRELEVNTKEPGVVFYSGNWLSEKLRGRNAESYPKNGAFCNRYSCFSKYYFETGQNLYL